MKKEIIALVLQLVFAAGVRAETHNMGESPREADVLDGKSSGVPQVLKMYHEKGASCTATVVSAETLITAAHCIDLKLSYKVDLNSAKGGAPNFAQITCVANPKYPAPTDADRLAFQQTQKAVIDACKAAKADPSLWTKVDELEATHQAARRKTNHLTPEQTASDLAVCKLVSGKFDVAPAKLARVDYSSTRYQLTGYGCTGYSKDAPETCPPGQRSGNLTLQKSKSPGLIESVYKKGDPEKSSSGPGDSGGPLMAKSGGGVSISGVVSASTSGGNSVLNRNLCQHFRPGREEGATFFSDLYSPESQKFLSLASSKGFKIDGITPSSQVASSSSSATKSSNGVSNPAPSAVAANNSPLPVIPIGVPHAAPTLGKVYVIGGNKWKYRGGGAWDPATVDAP